MSFNSTHCRQNAYVVLTFWRNRLNELVLIQEVFIALLVLLSMLHESCAGKLRQLGLIGGPQQHLAYLLLDRRHDEKMVGCSGDRVSIGFKTSQGVRYRDGLELRGVRW